MTAHVTTGTRWEVTANAASEPDERLDHGPTVRRLVDALTERLGPVALRFPADAAGRFEGDTMVRVSAFDVRTATGCQARAAAPPDPFEPALHTATRTIALRAGRRARRFSTLLEAVADTVKQLRHRRTGDSPFDPDEWLILYLQSLPLDMRARLVARATTWLTATLDLVAGVGGLDHRAIRGWQWEPRAAWSYPGRGLRLETKIDLALPELGNFTPVMVTAGAHPSALDRVAYSTVLWTINRRRVPDQVVMVAQSEQTARVLEPSELFERGLEAATRTVEAVSRRPPAILDPGVVEATDPDPGHRSFPLDLAVSASFLVCVDCSWRSLCPSPHPDAGVSRARDDPAGRPAVERAAITIRGGVRMPNGDTRRQ